MNYVDVVACLSKVHISAISGRCGFVVAVPIRYRMTIFPILQKLVLLNFVFCKANDSDTDCADGLFHRTIWRLGQCFCKGHVL